MLAYRYFSALLLALFALPATALIPVHSLKNATRAVRSGKIVTIDGIEYDCSDPRRDNDEMAQACKDILPDPVIQEIGSRKVYLTYDEVMARFTPYIESQFDAFIIANSSDKINAEATLVRPQHIMIVRKKTPGTPLFTRNGNGIINGLIQANVRSIDDRGEVPTIIPTSTGARRFLRSFSGIFEVNSSRSTQLNTRNRRTNFKVPMSNALYLGYRYPERISYAAMHGTPLKNVRLLGKQRASHGCMRIHPMLAQKIFPAVMSMTGDIPDFDWDYALPEKKFQLPNWRFGDSEPTGVKKIRGKKVLFLIFNGHGEAEHYISPELKTIDI
jgi:hypothetical protein